MGTDNIFHKRKAKRANNLKRRSAKRAPYAKILIVCEGEKTETSYFEGVVNFYSLNSANVEVCGDCGSDPMSIFRYAKQRFREEQDLGDRFDKVYCVFDRDSHANYSAAVSSINSMTPKDTYHAITSVPCFEYWLLLHFDYSTQPFVSTQAKSAGAIALDKLKEYMPHYEKAQKSVFSELVGQLEFAKQNAARALKETKERADDNPSTRVHLLVDFMQNIKNNS
ncbi:RloB family protein [Idiomarina sp. Sol25]|uniref:RloB family protein n=1 Tax=Idiomarina sp. Sol25 TaxID=3064000 RepID=UPI00294AB6A3|nr:RloB family protein [Idiomarina sp. Sol25]MDV6326852.1 RloB family protein [Idiomarina sp. Sol25]